MRRALCGSWRLLCSGARLFGCDTRTEVTGEDSLSEEGYETCDTFEDISYAKKLIAVNRL